MSHAQFLGVNVLKVLRMHSIAISETNGLYPKMGMELSDMYLFEGLQ